MGGQTLEKAAKKCTEVLIARVFRTPGPKRQKLWQLPKPDGSEESGQPSVIR